MAKTYTVKDYTVGIICALEWERTAMQAMMDGDKHARLSKRKGDNNEYTFGKIGHHNVVIASLPADEYGEARAAVVAKDMHDSFDNLRYCLLVGIAGAIPHPDDAKRDLRLGDIVVGCVNNAPPVIAYKFGKDNGEDFEITSQAPGRVPAKLASAVGYLAAQHNEEGPTYLRHLAKMLKLRPRYNESRPVENYYNLPDSADELMDADGHKIIRQPRELVLPDTALENEKFVRKQADGSFEYPSVFRGSIGSANTVMKDAKQRDQTYDRVLKQRNAKLLCLEMEAYGVTSNLPCLVIRGICDYCDSSKNKDWQRFASATAAAYAKDLLYGITPEEVASETPIKEAMSEGEESTGPTTNISNYGSGPVNTLNGSGTQWNNTQIGNNSKQFNSTGNVTFRGRY